MLSGHSRYGTEVLRVPALHKDGRALSIAFTVALVNSPDSESLQLLQSFAMRLNDGMRNASCGAGWPSGAPDLVIWKSA